MNKKEEKKEKKEKRVQSSSRQKATNITMDNNNNNNTHINAYCIFNIVVDIIIRKYFHVILEIFTYGIIWKHRPRLKY